MNDIDADLDGIYTGPEQRAAAARYLTRTGNADLLDVLGLVEAPKLKPKPYVIVNGISLCATCRMRVKADGVCRRVQCPAGRRDQGDGVTRRAADPGRCGRCGNKLPKHGVCRKTGRCREAAALAEMEAL